MTRVKKQIDPVCLIHGKRMSEHVCLYCCLCFKSLTPEECHVREDGMKEDVCNECAEMEQKMMKKYGHEIDDNVEQLKAAETEIENITDVLKNLYDLCKDGYATAGCLWQVQDAKKALIKAGLINAGRLKKYGHE